MATLQGSARFSGASLFEQYNSDSPRVGNRLFNKAWGETSGVSCDPSYASAPPSIDPAVAALNAQLVKTWGVRFP